MKISSLQNIRIKQAIKLRNKRERDQTQQYLIEGYRELQRAFVGGASIHTLFYSITYLANCLVFIKLGMV